jgi:phytoene/squalene synthetase
VIGARERSGPSAGNRPMNEKWASLQQVSTPREVGQRKFHVPVHSIRAPRGAIERAVIRDAETYERYAIECERIARTMSGEQRKSLLGIAEAWRELAREAERRLPKSHGK